MNMDEIYRKVSQVLSVEEVGALLQDRSLLSYIISTEFKGEYVVSTYDMNANYLGGGYAISIAALDSGELVIKAEFGD